MLTWERIWPEPKHTDTCVGTHIRGLQMKACLNGALMMNAGIVVPNIHLVNDSRTMSLGLWWGFGSLKQFLIIAQLLGHTWYMTLVN